MRFLMLWFAAVALVVVGCKGDDSSPSTSGSSAGSGAATTPAPSGPVSLTGQGATFPAPLYQKWIKEYAAVEKNAQISYTPSGSGAGIKAVTDKTNDFGASDKPMSDEEMGKAGKVLHVPMTLGAVVVTYNLPGNPKLKMTPDVVAAIFMGDIKKWNDPKLTALNPDAKLPDVAMGPAYRSDGSGTTAVFTGYLAMVSPTFKDKVGAGTTVKWATSFAGAKGNDGVTNQVKSTPGAIGYVELVYALQNSLPTATIQNKSGKWVDATLASITAAGAAAQIPDDMRAVAMNMDGDAVYPIASFSFVLVPQDIADTGRATALVNFLWWAAHDGQKYSEALNYSQLPAPVVTRVEAKLKSITSNGKPVLANKS